MSWTYFDEDGIRLEGRSDGSYRFVLQNIGVQITRCIDDPAMLRHLAAACLRAADDLEREP